MLSLDADEEVEPALAKEIRMALAANPEVAGFWVPRKNFSSAAGFAMAAFILIPSCAFSA